MGGVGGDNDLIKRKRKTVTGYAKSRHYLGEGENKQKTVTWCVAVRCTQNVRRYASSFSCGTSHVTINSAVTTAVAIQKWAV